MHKRVRASGADVGIAVEIPVGVEQRVRIAALRGAVL